MTDPLPFAMVLTAIVISLGITAFGVALAYRAWQLFGHDEVPDDVEDRRVLRRRRRRTEGETEHLPWSQALTEESRRGARPVAGALPARGRRSAGLGPHQRGGRPAGRHRG